MLKKITSFAEINGPMPAPTFEEQVTTEPTRRFRFTLRSLFVVVTMVAAVIGLLLRYPDCVGFLFAVMVLLGGWCYLRGKESEAVAFLALLLVFWLVLQFFDPYTRLRNRVVWLVGTARLQHWAVELLDNPPLVDKKDDAQGDVVIYRDALPKDIRSVAGNFTRVYLSRGCAGSA